MFYDPEKDRGISRDLLVYGVNNLILAIVAIIAFREDFPFYYAAIAFAFSGYLLLKLYRHITPRK